MSRVLRKLVACALFISTGPLAASSALPGVEQASEPAVTPASTSHRARKGVELSWQGARVYLPYTTLPATIDQIPEGKAYGVVLFMHGCWGFETEEHGQWGRLLASRGLLVIMPDSFARPNHQRRCDPIDNRGGTQPEVHDMRVAEIEYAAKQIRQRRWFDGRNLFLMGYSEGAIAAVRTPLPGFSGVISISWTCTHHGYAPLHGIRLPKDTPLLTISYDDDPWFPAAELQGNCGQHMAHRKRARHITLPSQGEIHRIMYKFDRRFFNIFNTQSHDHGAYTNAYARAEVLHFIEQHMGTATPPKIHVTQY